MSRGRIEASPRRRIALLVPVALWLALLGACIPVPWPKTYVIQPPLTVTVHHAGAPVEDAELVLVRGSHPRTEPLRYEVDRFTTDEAGHIALPEVERTETVMPLMMHGVHQYFWTWCVHAPGRGAVRGSLGPTGGALTVDLPGGAGRCEVVEGQAEVAGAEPGSR